MKLTYHENGVVCLFAPALLSPASAPLVTWECSMCHKLSMEYSPCWQANRFSVKAWGPPSLLNKGCRVSFPGVKRPGRCVDHPPHLAPRLKKEYSYISISPFGLDGLLFGEPYLLLWLTVPAGNPMIVFASCDVCPEALAPTHHRGLFPRSKVAEAWSWPVAEFNNEWGLAPCRHDSHRVNYILCGEGGDVRK